MGELYYGFAEDASRKLTLEQCEEILKTYAPKSLRAAKKAATPAAVLEVFQDYIWDRGKLYEDVGLLAEVIHPKYAFTLNRYIAETDPMTADEIRAACETLNPIECLNVFDGLDNDSLLSYILLIGKFYQRLKRTTT